MAPYIVQPVQRAEDTYTLIFTLSPEIDLSAVFAWCDGCGWCINGARFNCISMVDRYEEKQHECMHACMIATTTIVSVNTFSRVRVSPAMDIGLGAIVLDHAYTCPFSCPPMEFP